MIDFNVCPKHTDLGGGTWGKRKTRKYQNHCVSVLPEYPCRTEVCLYPLSCGIDYVSEVKTSPLTFIL